MSVGPVVSDASPLIALERIGRLDLLPALVERVVIPPAVSREIGVGLSSASWIDARGRSQPIAPRIVAADLGAGESEALSLAIDLGAHQVILDEAPARQLAQELAISLIGALCIVIAATYRGLVPAIRPTVEALIATGFRLDADLVEMALVDASER